MFCLQCSSFLFWGIEKNPTHQKMNRSHSGVFPRIDLFQIQFHFCWWYSKSKHTPQWFSGLLLLAETYSQTCCQFSCRLGGSVFRDCLVSYDLKSGTPCFLPWVSVPVSGTGSCWLTDWPNRCFFKWENQGFLQIIKVLVAVFY